MESWRSPVKAAVVAATLIPAALLAVGLRRIASGDFYTRYIINNTGDWGFRFLVFSLCVTPLRRLTGWHSVIQLRRTLGLAAFFYSVIHVVLWAMLDWSFELPTMVERVTHDLFYAIGTAAFVLLIPLAVTSNRASISRLGRRWRRVHQLTYLALAAGLAHYWLSGPLTVPVVERWIVAVAALFGMRIMLAHNRSAEPASRAMDKHVDVRFTN
jgi:sulfoxide reductase heme-binding subunit YedZ